MLLRKNAMVVLSAVCGFALWGTGIPYAQAAPDPPTPPSSPCETFGVQKISDNTLAPPFTLKALDGKKVALQDLKGKPLLLFFWRSNCGSCKEDLPLLENFAQGKGEQLRILTVALDGEREKKISRISRKLKMTLPVLLLYKESVIDDYQLRMIPTAVFIDQDGKIVGKAIGQRDWSSPDAWSATQEIFGLR